MSNALSLQRALCIVALLLPTPVFAFTDVDATDVNAEAIGYVQTQGIVQGYADGTFKPKNNINRAEFTKIVVAALFEAQGGDCFSDVKNEWFAPYICVAKTKGIIGGYADGTFKPTQNISFAEAAKIIAIAFEKDPPAGDVWYEGYVRALASDHAIPTSIDSFTKQLTRGEMAELIYRLHAKVSTKESVSYEKLAGLPETQSQGGVMPSSSSRATSSYPNEFVIGKNWKTDWNFYIDTTSDPVEKEKGYNFLAALHVDNAELMEDSGGQFPSFLRINFPAGSASPFISNFYEKPLGGVIARALGTMRPAESLRLTYYVRFPKDFDFSHEGSLPSLGGGITTSNYGAFGNEFSVGLYWTKKAEIGVSGSFDTNDDGQSRVTGSSFTADNEWHRIDIVATMNTVPVKRKNGVLKISYDNSIIFSFDDVRFRSRAEELWDSIGFYATNGDGNAYFVEPKDAYLDLAGFVVNDK